MAKAAKQNLYKSDNVNLALQPTIKVSLTTQNSNTKQPPPPMTVHRDDSYYRKTYQAIRHNTGQASINFGAVAPEIKSRGISRKND